MDSRRRLYNSLKNLISLNWFWDLLELIETYWDLLEPTWLQGVEWREFNTSVAGIYTTLSSFLLAIAFANSEQVCA